MKRSTLILIPALALAVTPSAFAQHSPQHSQGNPGGGPPSGPRSDGGSGMGAPHSTDAGAMTTHTNVSHRSPDDVLGHNPVIGDKIQALTGQNAQAACSGFKNIGQCVAAAHVAKNLDIPDGFDALKAKLTGTGAVSLGKAIQQLAPQADAKTETKKASKQASEDLEESNS